VITAVSWSTNAIASYAGVSFISAVISAKASISAGTMGSILITENRARSWWLLDERSIR